MSSAAGILREGNPEPRAGTLLRSILAASDCGAARGVARLVHETLFRNESCPGVLRQKQKLRQKGKN